MALNVWRGLAMGLDMLNVSHTLVGASAGIPLRVASSFGGAGRQQEDVIAVAGGTEGYPAGGAAPYQTPTLGIDFQGSAGASAAPFCNSSTEMLSGERTKAMRPSRGGRLMVTPWSISRWQVA